MRAIMSLGWRQLSVKTLVVMCLCITTLHAHALLQMNQNSTRCTEVNKEYPFPDQPGKADAGRIIRAELKIDSTTRVTVSERAISPDDDNYDSEVAVTSARKAHAFEVPRLIQSGRALRLLKARVVCSQGAKETVILGFESGWTGARQAFVVVSLSGGTLNVFGTKVLHQGKLVLDKTRPDHFELWSASPKDDGLCGACAKHYVVYDCEADRGVVACKQRPRLTGPLGPNAVTGELIEVH